jgi:hypothetical protein
MMEGEERDRIHEEGIVSEDDLEGSVVDGPGLDSTAAQREDEENEDGPFPSLEVFLYLLKKNMSRRKTNRLTPDELDELNRVRRRLTEEQWNSFLEKARESRRFAHTFTHIPCPLFPLHSSVFAPCFLMNCITLA